MILVTGGTGFIGRMLVQELLQSGHKVRLLMRPTRQTPNLPKGLPVEVAVTSLKEPRGLRAAMRGIKTVYHLAGGERSGAYVSLLENDIQGTQAVTQAAVEAGVERIFYLSHLGAERASAYPLLKAKAIAEEYIRKSGIDYTIFRCAVVFGEGDNFTTRFAWLAQRFPFVFLLPGDGSVKLQPLLINDLVSCLVWSLEDETTRNQTYDIGGGEFISFAKSIEIICETMGIRRTFVHVFPAYLRYLTIFLESTLPFFPLSIFWLDYLSADRTCSVDTLPRQFHLIPAQFSLNLEYLKLIEWGFLPRFSGANKKKK